MADDWETGTWIPSLYGTPNDGLDTTTGTWAGITRSTEPAWRSIPFQANTSITPGMIYFLSNTSRIVFSSPGQCGIIDGIGVPEPVDPWLKLPEGL